MQFHVNIANKTSQYLAVNCTEMWQQLSCQASAQDIGQITVKYSEVCDSKHFLYSFVYVVSVNICGDL